ncbi:MAG: hypothetical protein PWQ17_2586 [Anaerophaga sp.]|nr:hypothetical protein [Anaerophaga sp.]MDK2843079.1 hypothetical protein [Anaerophaga sp.]
MTKVPQKNMYKTQSCEFHQANNLDLFYTDEEFCLFLFHAKVAKLRNAKTAKKIFDE